MLSLDQVDHFLKNHLKIPDWNVVLNQDRVEFLRRVCRSHVINIYFQILATFEPKELLKSGLASNVLTLLKIHKVVGNILSQPLRPWCGARSKYILQNLLLNLQTYLSWIQEDVPTRDEGISIAAQEESKRTNPSIDNIIKIGLDGTGGCCLHLNYFIHLVLQALGFQSFVSAASWANSLLVGSHCVTIVTISENEKYLLDVGGGIPNYEIIPLHYLPFRTIAGGLPFEFRYSESHGLYQRIQLKGRFYRGDFEPGRTEELKYTFNLEPNTFEDFDENMKILFMDPPNSIFFKNTFMFRHFEESGKLKFVHIWGTDVLEGDAVSRQVTNYKSYKEMPRVIKKYFPDINDNELISAIKYFEAAEAANYTYA